MDSNRFLPFAGRLLIGVPFAMSGLGKLAAYGKKIAMIASVGLPVLPLAYAVAVAFERGILLLPGYKVRVAAIALALFCFVTAFSSHRNFSEQNEMIQFLKNVMIAGGLLQIAAFGAGALSLDSRFSKDRGIAAKSAPV